MGCQGPRTVRGRLLGRGLACDGQRNVGAAGGERRSSLALVQGRAGGARGPGMELRGRWGHGFALAGGHVKRKRHGFCGNLLVTCAQGGRVTAGCSLPVEGKGPPGAPRPPCPRGLAAGARPVGLSRRQGMPRRGGARRGAPVGRPGGPRGGGCGLVLGGGARWVLGAGICTWRHRGRGGRRGRPAGWAPRDRSGTGLPLRDGHAGRGGSTGTGQRRRH